ncbi:unnamed protein product [Brachionus calyciflorus]|uniref:DNA-directed DNA polymerase n=1 Tax=Brachionus calyciflorus TaxID=104777 RepID=A0A814DCS2_9BILA|nr:unnamed protein product [Brachionus calyciflorus]
MAFRKILMERNKLSPTDYGIDPFLTSITINFVVQNRCTHSVEEKCLEGTWVTLEVQEALRQGCQMVEIYEVWPDGYPEYAKSDEEYEKNIKDYYEREGVKLDSEKIQKIRVFYSTNVEMHSGSLQTSVVLAAFVTCNARLKLYEELKKIDKRVLYFDTDSIINVRSPGQYRPPLGDYLGDFTDEINKKDSSHIVEFISAGPKNYAYKMDNGKTSCTVKGFTLNHISSLVIYFDSIRDIVLNERKRKKASSGTT